MNKFVSKILMAVVALSLFAVPAMAETIKVGAILAVTGPGIISGWS